MSLEDYSKALKAGKRDYQRHLSKGAYPYLQALDEITSHIDIVSEVRLGLVSVPAQLLVGTKTIGRRTAFAPNFMPLLDIKTEFSAKWISLCGSHLEEGIHDPITAYEYMNRFYVVEGNKRVSVLKYFGAATIPAVVTRMIPARTDDRETIIYYEFMEFYRLSLVNYIYFSQEGSFAKLNQAVNPTPGEPWDEDTRLYFASAFARFQNAFQARGGDKMKTTLGDAMLAYINVFGYEALKVRSQADLKTDMQKIWDEFRLMQEEESVDLLMNPAEEQKKGLMGLLKPSGPKELKLAFIHTKNSQISGWTYAHELGRKHVEQVFSKQVETLCIDNVGIDLTAEEAIGKAIEAGCRIIFTTSPEMVGASLRAAVQYPSVKILNCSLNMSHSYIRTYYGRMYEAKFLCGAIAGALADDNRIGYVADYPIYGMTANINAFALGARMVNPRAEIHLKWSTVKDQDLETELNNARVSYVSSQDMIVPQHASRQFGLYRWGEEPQVNVATPLWHWGNFYEKIIRNIMSGAWKDEVNPDGARALNYWWGMSAGVIDLIYSSNLPAGTKRLINFLRSEITAGDFHPFRGVLYSQNGPVQTDEHQILSPEEIITMDWLADNVIGSIPGWEQLTDSAKPVVTLQGLGSYAAKKKV